MTRGQVFRCRARLRYLTRFTGWTKTALVALAALGWLGLTLVRSLVEAMAGQVSLRSQLSQGSVFTISLPI